MTMYGYHGRILRVNLSNGQIAINKLDEEDLKKYVGGTGIGAKFLYEEVPPGVEWFHPENRIIIGVGPLNATIVSGTGTFTIVTKGPMTNGAVDTQANGFFGAFLKLCGFDGIIIQGQAEKWCYLHIYDGGAELLNANHLIGKDTWETEEAIKKELNYRKTRTSVYSIGPAGERLVRYAAFVGDHGHVASKGGVGAVFGSKKLKAIAVEMGENKVPIKDNQALIEASNELYKSVMNTEVAIFQKWGVHGLMLNYARAGLLPIKNYTTSVFPEELAEKLSGQYMRTHFEHKIKTCWACKIAHNRYTKVTEGPYKGFEGEEPDYEPVAGFGPQIGNTDPGATVMLTNLADRLGLDSNEASWVLGFVMECYEKGILRKEDLDGLEARWGDVEVAKKILIKIAKREGVGNLLAEGTKYVAQKIGGEAVNIGIFTWKGSTPRSHDHRARWSELLDTCTSNTSTIEATGGRPVGALLGIERLSNLFSPEDIARMNAKYNGWHIFENSLVICRFNTFGQYKALIKAVNAVTGWSLTLDDILTIGKRIVNLLRAFNIRHGLNPELEKPSPRYGSTPIDGPVAGIGIMPHFEKMLKIYRAEMGWDIESGKPLPETLRKLGLDFVIKDIWK